MQTDERLNIDSCKTGIFWKVTSTASGDSEKISYLLGTAHGRFKTPPELIPLFESKKIIAIAVEWPKRSGNLGPHVQTLLTKQVPNLDHAICQTAAKYEIQPHILDEKQDMDLFEWQAILKLDEEKYSWAQEIRQVFRPSDSLYESYLALHNTSKYTQDDKNPLFYLYQTRQISALKKYVENHSTTESLETLLYKRNQKWLPKILDLLNKGQVCIIAGLSHFIVNQGLIDILTEKGYRLEPLDITIESSEELTTTELKKISHQACLEDLSIKNLERLHLNELVRAYHNNSLSFSQKSKLNLCLNLSYAHLFSTQDPALISAVGDSRHSMWYLYQHQQKSMPRLFSAGINQEEWLTELFTLNTDDPHIIAKQIGYALWVCCLYPELAKKLLDIFPLLKVCGGQALGADFVGEFKSPPLEHKTEEFKIPTFESIVNSCLSSGPADWRHKQMLSLQPLVQQAYQSDCFFLEELDDKLYGNVSDDFDPISIKQQYLKFIKNPLPDSIPKASQEKYKVSFELVLRRILLKLVHHFYHDKTDNHDFYSQLAFVEIFKFIARKQLEDFQACLNPTLVFTNPEQWEKYLIRERLIQQLSLKKLTDIYGFDEIISLPRTEFNALKKEVDEFVNYAQSLTTKTDIDRQKLPEIKRISKALQVKISEISVDEISSLETKTITVSPLVYCVFKKEFMKLLYDHYDTNTLAQNRSLKYFYGNLLFAGLGIGLLPIAGKLIYSKATQNRFLLWGEETRSIRYYHKIQKKFTELFNPKPGK